MLNNISGFRNVGRCVKRVAICAGIGLLILQTPRSSGQVYTYGWQYSGTPQFTASGNGGEDFTFNSPQESSGTLWLTSDVPLSDPTDPILTINASVNNDSSFVWTGYILNLQMNQTFSINSANVTSPSGWSDNITQPSGPDGNGNYAGTIDYFVTAGGTPVPFSPAQDNTFSFGYQIQFDGTTSYSFTQTATPVPEPSTIGFLLAGCLLFGGRMLFKRAQAKVCYAVRSVR
jgi:hypothetical protein